MLSTRPLRLALLALLALLLIPAAAVKAAPKMPIGFYDDPSFRWAAEARFREPAAGRRRRTRPIIHALADWRQIAPDKPKNPLNGDDPAYNLTDLDALVRTAPRYNLQVFITISGTPEWANGGKTPNHPPTNLNDLTQFAHMLAARYNGRTLGFGAVTRWAVWNEPNLELFLTPQFRRPARSSARATYAKLYMAAYKGIKAGNPNASSPSAETSNRGHNQPTGGQRLGRAGHVRAPASRWPTRSCRSPPGRPIRIRRLPPRPERRASRIRTSTMTTARPSSARTCEKWFHRRVPIWITEYGRADRRRSTPLRRRQPRAAGGRREDRARQLARRTRTSRCSSGSSSGTRRARPGSAGSSRRTGRRSRRTPPSRRPRRAIDGQTQIVNPRQVVLHAPARRPVPDLRQLRPAPGRHHLRVYAGQGVAASASRASRSRPTRPCRFKVKFKPAKGATYTLTVDVRRQARPGHEAHRRADVS